ncbi:uncharacterized protein LOC120349480 [Nilaparvata lugens]|uniref:uncharacterized protein LOC120349480 n=1 Tax=Nilaparvata lugens TaxID=108931 RepID=UPI00193E8A3E|nr:uncharacterized protein LOC120349480 [Nilaparvata lugens]
MASCHLWLLTALAILLAPTGVFPRPRTHESATPDQFPKTHESADRYPNTQELASRDSSPQQFVGSSRSDRSPKTLESTDRFPGTQEQSSRTQALADDDIDISKVRSSGPKFSLDAIVADSQRTSRYLLGSRTMERMLVDFLDTLPEDDLRAMEELVPGSSSSSEEVEEDLDGGLSQGDLIQGDMPASAENNGTQMLNSTDSDGNYTDQLQKANRER